MLICKDHNWWAALRIFANQMNRQKNNIVQIPRMCMRRSSGWHVTAGVRSGDNLGQSQQQSTSVGTIRFISSPHIPFYEELNCWVSQCHPLAVFHIATLHILIRQSSWIKCPKLCSLNLLTQVCCLQTIISSSQHIETRSKRSKRTPPNIDGDSRAY